MTGFKTYTLAASLMLSIVAGPTALAQSQTNQLSEDHVLADGELTNEELAIVLLTAEKDLNSLLDKAIASVESDVEAAGVFRPRAWMIMKDKEIKEVIFADEASQAPPEMKLHMIRVSLKSLARHDGIDSALIVYPGTIQKDDESQRVVVVEHEHRLGVSGTKLIPLELSGGKVAFGGALSQKKPFQIFYDKKQ